MRRYLLTTAVLFLASLLAADVPAVVLTSATTPSGTGVTMNTGPGIQTDPHVRQNLATYADVQSGQIRYYSLLDLAISNVTASRELARDNLPDAYNNSVVFARQTLSALDIMLFDTVSSTVTTIDPSPEAQRLTPGIGENTNMYADYGLPGDVGLAGGPLGEIVAHDIAASTATRLTNNATADQNPQVAPNGNLIVWETCPTPTNCDINQAVRSRATWTVSILANTADSERNPDTDATNVVYHSNRPTSVAGTDIYFRLVDGGPETQLEIAGVQSNPSIAAGIIAFESSSDGVSARDRPDTIPGKGERP